ncbi:MAG: aminopeptidase N [Gammaproteobacteria bacterium]|nr:aminopeptidase N [Gammaproteobacteria bacterium]
MLELTTQPQAKFRADYQPPAFAIETVDLTFELAAETTQVTNTMVLRRLGNEDTLRLDGEQLKLEKVLLNDHELGTNDFVVDGKSLTLREMPEQFQLTIITTINPSANTALEGLYLSEGTFCTQCEAEGFRRITYFLDRPDVLAVYTTTIIAERGRYPHLLSNGNLVKREQCDGQDCVTWHDPHPKPSYLFALVAGDFDLLEDRFITRDERVVTLQLFVDKGNLDKADYAMGALKRAMQWDEERFNLIYDLDIYMIVAVDFFNMGAMENKGLNIFNSKYVLANAQTATDQDFLNVESVIGHEYFHNWTGNRITCRDWFQLSLKEGLTVFRDQEFSADLGMRAVNRIQDARIMRTHQFDEDSGPMAHPIRPDRVVEMNNFYTVTVYNKGAEVIRMLHTLLGETGFQAGIALYIQRHDGQAVTCEDFVTAMEDANQVDLQQFRLWYSQAGTPLIEASEAYDQAAQRYTLTLRQSVPATIGQEHKQPMHIPVRVEFVNSLGKPLPISDNEGQTVSVLELREGQQHFVFEGVKERPIAGLLADFSAPVRLRMARSEAELLALIAGGSDAFLRWDAVQQFYLQRLHQAIRDDEPVDVPQNLIDVLGEELGNRSADPALTALLLQVPSEEAVSQDFQVIPVRAICRVVNELRLALAQSLRSELLQVTKLNKDETSALSSTAIARRMLTNTAMSLLALLPDEDIEQVLEQYFNIDSSMTLQFGALQAAVHANHRLTTSFLNQFANRWSHDVLVMDKWLAVQATSPQYGTVEKIASLVESAYFNWRNPNRIYALLASFTHNLGQLHAEDGEGYRFVIAAIRRLNSSNPQVASRLLSPLLKWRKLPTKQQQLLKTELVSLSQLDNLAPDLYEKVNQTLSEN